MISLPTYAPGPGVNLADLGTPKRELVPIDEVCWLDCTVGKDAMATEELGRELSGWRARSALDRAIVARVTTNLRSCNNLRTGFSHYTWLGPRLTTRWVRRAPPAAAAACIFCHPARAVGHLFSVASSAMLSLVASWSCAFSITTLHPGRRRCLSARAEAQEGGLARAEAQEGGLARAPQEATAASTRQARVRPPSAVVNQPDGTGHTQLLGTCLAGPASSQPDLSPSPSISLT